jgi:UDP-N-acetylmuramoyl-tripeptide--D-alanyl-D-alanine ligase
MAGDVPIFTVRQVLTATGGSMPAGELSDVFCGISTDSRKVGRGDLFVALKGDNFDGHDFVGQALDNGAAGILIRAGNNFDIARIKKASVIEVGDTLQALGDMAGEYRKRFPIPVIGLTGSSGKTTTKEMLAAIIGRRKKILATEGNLNNLIGLPQTIFRLTADHELAILEMGTNTRGEIRRLTQIAGPDIGLITNIGPAHLAGFGSMEIVRAEKGDLFLNMARTGTIVVNVDDEAVRSVAAGWQGCRITFGMSLDADVTARDIEKNGARGVRFNLVIGDKVNKVDMKIVGIHHVYNALAAAAAAWAAGFDCRTIAEGLAAFRPVPGRMQMIKLTNCAFVLDDTYNANPASVREALITLKDLKNHHNAYVFLGDMLELGAEAHEMHRRIGILVATIGVNALFLKGEFAKVTASGAEEGGMPSQNVFFLSDDADGMNYLREHLKKGDWILVKGSRLMKMEKIVAKICDLFGRDEDRKNSNA